MKHIKRFTALFFEYLYRFIQFLLSPIVIYIALICIQAIYLLYFASILTDFNGVVRFLFISLSAFMIFYLISKDENTNYKMTWIFFIMLLPNVGGLLYLLLGNKRPSRWLKKKIQPEVQYFNQTRQQDHKFQKANSIRQITKSSLYHLATFINKIGSHNSFMSVIIHFIYKMKFFRNFILSLDFGPLENDKGNPLYFLQQILILLHL